MVLHLSLLFLLFPFETSPVTQNPIRILMRTLGTERFITLLYPVAHLDYPSHPFLRYISWDVLATCFCERAMLWGELLNFTTIDFAKGLRILNMVMTFVLTPRSHYNTITKPCAHFLFSLLKGLSIDFPSLMIVSMIDIYQDTATLNKLIFPSAITLILTHMYISIHFAALFPIMGAIT